ncbi:novel immune-type receptor 13 isoform X1 [Ctenopharyngodon idella]|uniref:novel immune-type receptor 13 isoform X1 n=1 Tax=Ctenopharyngodon idella TaxID=7959 RepID=UPI00222F49BD|nr:novel immune-type receptor 13 isoform X1 [Ctenopharyngodon idella]
MMIIWISVMLLSEMYSTHSEVVSQPDPVMMASVGDKVTLRCFSLIDHSDPITWYKQTAGHQPQAVAMVQKLAKYPMFFNNFESSHFSIETDSRKCHLTISNVTSSDEGMYYCGWRKYETYFAGGTYLALKGSQNNQYKSVSVLQHPVSEPVQSGDTVTLLCSVLSEYNTADIRMFWFRSESGKSEILYTHNQSNYCETDSARNCTFSLSKNIVSQMDAGTYYCAVVTCGKILFGNGTNINMVNPVDPLVIILGVLLGVCVVVITVQAILSHKKERYYCNKEKELKDTENEHPTSQDHDAVELSYAALHFKEGKNRRVQRKGETPQDSVYNQITDHSILEYKNM